jgi:hypothetical protein
LHFHLGTVVDQFIEEDAPFKYLRTFRLYRNSSDLPESNKCLYYLG